jgi:hypothetical protein
MNDGSHIPLQGSMENIAHAQGLATISQIHTDADGTDATLQGSTFNDGQFHGPASTIKGPLEDSHMAQNHSQTMPDKTSSIPIALAHECWSQSNPE